MVSVSYDCRVVHTHQGQLAQDSIAPRPKAPSQHSKLLPIYAFTQSLFGPAPRRRCSPSEAPHPQEPNASVRMARKVSHPKTRAYPLTPGSRGRHARLPDGEWRIPFRGFDSNARRRAIRLSDSRSPPAHHSSRIGDVPAATEAREAPGRSQLKAVEARHCGQKSPSGQSYPGRRRHGGVAKRHRFQALLRRWRRNRSRESAAWAANVCPRARRSGPSFGRLPPSSGPRSQGADRGSRLPPPGGEHPRNQ